MFSFFFLAFFGGEGICMVCICGGHVVHAYLCVYR